MRYQISCHSDHVFGLPNTSRNPCLNISPQYKFALIRNSQAWAPACVCEGKRLVGVTGL